MTSYEVQLHTGEVITVEADAVEYDALFVEFWNSNQENGNPELVAAVPIPNLKLLRVKPVDSP